MIVFYNSKELNHFEQKKPATSSELFFIVVWCLLLIIHCVENTSIIYAGVARLSILYRFKYLLYVLMLVKMAISSPYSLQQLISIGGVLWAGVSSYLGSRDFGIAELAIVCVAAMQVDIERLIKSFLGIKATAFVLTILLWWGKFLPTLYYKNGNGYYLTYGFCHRNVLGANVAVLCLAGLFLRYGKLKIVDVIFWLIAALGMYQIAFSRSTFLFISITAIGIYLYQVYGQFGFSKAFSRNILIALFLLMIGISLYFMVAYRSGSSIWRMLDNIFTTRIQSANYIYKSYGIHLFGNDIPFVSSIQAQESGVNKLILDNSYARLLLYYGLIPMLVFCVGYMFMMMKTLQNQLEIIGVCMFLFAVYGLSERYMLDPFYNFPLVIGFQYIFLQRKEENKRRKLVVTL